MADTAPDFVRRSALGVRGPRCASYCRLLAAGCWLLSCSAWASLGEDFITAGDALEARSRQIIDSPVAPYVNAPLDKLGRGVTNVFSSPLEWPATMHDLKHDRGRLAAWTIGPVQGAGRFVLRLCSGVADVVMFPFPVPRRAPWVRRQSLFIEETDRAQWVVQEAQTAQRELGRTTPAQPTTGY